MSKSKTDVNHTTKWPTTTHESTHKSHAHDETYKVPLTGTGGYYYKCLFGAKRVMKGGTKSQPNFGPNPNYQSQWLFAI